MEPDNIAAIETVAKLLIEARKTGTKIDGLASHLAPDSPAMAQAIDDRVAHLSGWDVLGWKIGATSELAQQTIGSPGPFAGRVYRILASGSTVTDGDAAQNNLLEAEIAFGLSRDIPAAAGAPDRGAVIAAIESLLPAIEVVGGRYTTFIGTPVHDLAADAGANTLLVLGDPLPLTDPEGLAQATAMMTIDGAQTGAGTGADVLDSPINALVWLVEHLGSRGIDLHAGQVVTTGTLTGAAPLPTGGTAVADFGPLGRTVLHRA